MNGPLRKVSILVALMMAALLVNVTWISVVRTDDLNAEPRNRRVRDAEFASDRGAILVGNTPIAITNPAEGRFSYAREYPDGPMFSAVTGWYSYDYARSELERQYNEELSGTGSVQSVSRIVDLLVGRQRQGANLLTTLDSAAQAAAVNSLGNKQGAAIAMNWESGEILALVSTPTYDPNRLSTLDLAEGRNAWDELLNAPDEPLKNRAVREVFPPGSTFKLVTASAALESGMLPSSELASPDSLPLPNSTRSMGNSTNCGGATVTLEQALITSCNTAFGSLGLKLGAEQLRATSEAFGFNAPSTIDLPSATSRFPVELDEAQTALSAIGQFDVAASPLQMLQVTAAIANDGHMMQPHLVRTVTGDDLKVIRSFEPHEIGRPLTEANAQLMQQMMEAVVSDGTGRPARIDGMTIGGKTGTAQSDPDRPPYAWFIGYAKEPKVAVVAFVQSADVERDDISGGRVAAPIFKAVLEALR